jgi:uncharacterized RDD family membrane protein YckC
MSDGDQRPESGPGSVAGIGVRIKAFIIDSVLCILIALAAGFRPGRTGYELTVYGSFLLIELLFVSVAGQTPGMRVSGVAVVRFADAKRAPFRWVLVRTLLLATVLPALVVDPSGRAMHDRAAGTVMIRTR